jgi:hypothetical protein
MLLAFYRLRPVFLVGSVDRRSFTPGVPGVGMARSLSVETISSATVLSGGE